MDRRNYFYASIIKYPESILFNLQIMFFFKECFLFFKYMFTCILAFLKCYIYEIHYLFVLQFILFIYQRTIRTKIKVERFVGYKLSHVLTALITSKDAKNDINLRLSGLECLYKNISITSEYLKCGNITDSLVNIVLELGNEDDNDWKYFQMKRYAFGCLEKVADDCSDEFFQNYYSYLKKKLNLNSFEEISSDRELPTKTFVDEPTDRPDIPEIKYMKELDYYVNTCDKTEKFRILKTLSIYIFESTHRLDLSIFEEFPSKDWGKELLTYTLLSNNTEWCVTQTSKLVSEINSLDTFLKQCDHPYYIEDVLEILITTQKTYELDVEFVVKVLTLLHCTESLDLILEDFCFLPNVFSQLELLQFKQKCNDQKIIYTDENQINELRYLLFYSDEVIDIVISKVKPGTPITALIEFFQIVRKKNINRKEDFLLQLNSNGSIEDWKRELYLPLIKTFISREFPGWEYETAADIISEFDQIHFLPVKADGNKKFTTYCQFHHTRKDELREAVNFGDSALLLRKSLYNLNCTLLKLTSKCEFSESTLEKIKRLIECLDSENKIIQLINALEILIEYEVNLFQGDALKIILNSTEVNVERNIHSFVIKNTFPGTYEKTVDELVDQLVSANREENIMFLKDRHDLMAEYNKVMNAYNNKSVFFREADLIKNWDKKTILKWSSFVKPMKMVKKVNVSADHGSFLIQAVQTCTLSGQSIQNRIDKMNQHKMSKHEKIAVIKRTMELTAKIKLREVQVLSVILLLNCEENKGRLAQINTGEGKTVTIAMIAACHALKGHSVDIITSSELLAIPQSKQFEEFYNTLSLTVSHNFNSSKAYEVDVLYGTSNEFQADILRDEFNQSDCRRGRKCDVAIVDEVDNMLVDGSNHIVFLSSYMPAMDHLETILATIYAQVKAAAGSIIIKNGQCFFIEPENVFDETGERKDKFIENHIPIQGSMRDFIMNSTETHIRNLIRDCESAHLSSDFPEIKIPKHLREFICKTQLKKWIATAINAKFHYMIKEDYILDNNKIKIVDANNTGVVQQGMKWSDGLHQFLEIKHGTNVTPERLTSIFISNVTFFRRYRPRIYGLSGTLGCQGTKKLLAKTYDMDFVIVPPFKFKQHKEISSIILNNRDDWNREIIKNSLRKLRNGRAVLIIMEYIKQTEVIEKIFVDEFGYDKRKIKLYKTNSDSSVVDAPLESGDVIITTNIAGRGTDIKLTEDVNKNGGLHVCVTFLPKNSRVEEQNIGRTSRTGNRGTSQFILCNSETAIAQLRKNRYEREQEILRNAEKQVEMVTTKDEIFQKFCQLMNQIECRNAFVKKIERQAVEERFALWLKIHSHEIENGPRSDLFKSFKSFRKEILRDDENGKLIQNPYMLVLIGNEYLHAKKYKNAISEYTLAIETDSNFAEHAHYNRGYAYIAEYGGNATKDEYFIDKAINDFKAARKLIKEREYSLHLMQHASEGEVFSKQVSNKLNLYNIQKSAIDVAIGPDIETIEQKIKEYENIKERDQMTSDDLKKISEEIKNLQAQKDNVGVIQRARSNKRNLTIQITKMRQCLPENDQSHNNEIDEFEGNGAIGSFLVSEIPPINWASVIGLLLLGLGQVVIGAALTVFTLGGGMSFGMGLITEGIGDIVTAVKDGIINRDFSWAKWAIEKAISLTVSVVCAGWKAIKDVAKTAYAGVKTGAAIGRKIVTQTVKEGWKIVAKKISFELAKGIGKDIVSNLVDYGVSQTLVPFIRQKIVEKVQGPIEETLKNNPLVKTMLEIDQTQNNHYYENRIMAMGMELLKVESSKDMFDFVGIAEKIGNRVADNKIPGLSLLRQANTAVDAVVELSTLTAKFISKLNEAIEKEVKEMKLKQLNNAEKTTDQQGSVFQKDHEEIKGDIDLNLLYKEEEQAKLQTPINDAKGMSKRFVDIISTRMINSIQQKLINPAIQAGVSYSVDFVTSNVTKSLNKQVEVYRSHKRIIHHQNKGFNNKKIQKEKNVEENERIKKVNKLIEDVRSGGPSSLVHLGAASDAIDRPIEVYDKNGKLKYVIGDTKQGTPVKIQYHEPKSGGKIGHYTLLGNKEPTKKSSNRNMCLYDVLSVQTGRDPDELKNTSLQIMESNKGYMVKQVDDIKRLEMYSQLRLAIVGARYDGTCPDDAENFLRNSSGAKAFHVDNLGHALHHVPFRGTIDQKLEAISQELGKRVIVYDKNGQILYSKGDHFKGKAIELDYHKPAGDTSGEWFSSRNGKEQPYRLHDPYDKTLYNIIGNQTKCNPDKLMSAVSDRVNQTPIPPNTYCIENYSIGGAETGFLSQADMNYLAHSALTLDEVKEAMNSLNNLDFSQDLTVQDCRRVLNIPIEKLGNSRKIYGQKWKKGRPTGNIKPVKSVMILLQHHDGKERDADAPVHIQTFYPRL